MTRQMDSLTLKDLINEIGNKGDLLVDALQCLGFSSADIGDGFCGSICEEWGISKSDLRREVVISRDSLGRIDSESDPRFV